MKRAGRYWWIAGILIAVALVLFSPLASPSPDGLERVAEDKGFIDEAEKSPIEVMPDYTVRWFGDGPASTIAAGLIGTLGVFGVVYGLSRIARRRNQSGSASDGAPGRVKEPSSGSGSVE